MSSAMAGGRQATWPTASAARRGSCPRQWRRPSRLLRRRLGRRRQCHPASAARPGTGWRRRASSGDRPGTDPLQRRRSLSRSPDGVSCSSKVAMLPAVRVPEYGRAAGFRELDLLTPLALMGAGMSACGRFLVIRCPGALFIAVASRRRAPGIAMHPASPKGRSLTPHAKAIWFCACVHRAVQGSAEGSAIATVTMY
jgi:hypothetical protein